MNHKITLIIIGLLFLLTLPLSSNAQLPAPADVLITASDKTVYYYANNGKRYVFPNEDIYYSWFFNFDDVVSVTDEELASIPIGGNVTHRPGVRMIKLQTDPKTYAVAPGGVLRWITSEQIAQELYGAEWGNYVNDVSDALFVNYTVGEPIESPEDYSPFGVAAETTSINANKGLPVSHSSLRANTAAPRTVSKPTEEPGEPLFAAQEELNTVHREQALNHINQLRASEGKEPLILNEKLSEIALVHSKDMALNINALSHDGSLGEAPSERIKQGKVPNLSDSGQFTNLPYPNDIGWNAENVGLRDTHYYGSIESAIQDLHEWFMQEPADEYNHRTTMLSTLAPFNQVGIGLFLDQNGQLWITEDFVSIE